MYKLVILLASMSLGFSSSSFGQIIVEHRLFPAGSFADVTNDPLFVDIDGPNVSGANLELLSMPGVYRVTTQFPTTQDIGTITYNGTSDIKLLVSSFINTTVTSQGQPAAKDWAGLTGTGTDNIDLQVRLNGNLTGNVTVGRLFRIDADSGIDEGLTIRQTVSKQSITVRSALGGIGADIVLEQGSLDRVETQGDFTGSLTIENGDLNEIIRITGGGDLLGDIRVENGFIKKIWVQGDIGSPTKPVTIFAGLDVRDFPNNESRFTIWYLLCRGDMYANITASDGAAKEGQFKRIRANEGVDDDGRIPAGVNDAPSNFTGTITTYTAIEIENDDPFEQIPCIMFNDVLASSTIHFYDEPHSPITINALSDDSKILIGDDFITVDNPINPMGDREDSMLFIVDPMGLKGQVIINQGNDTGIWSGEFGIGGNLGAPGTEIKPTGGDDAAPYYSTLPATLGGGAIGLAPFNFHAQACTPAHDSSVTLDTPTLQQTFTAIVEHYGPIYDGVLNIGSLMKIEYCSDIGIPFQDVTADFDFAVPLSESTATRKVGITPKTGELWVTGVYRVSPLDIDCAYVTGNPPAEYSATSVFSSAGTHYVFMVSTEQTCFGNADVNGDGFVTPADFTAWIAAFNTGAPECDQNGDGLCQADDFTAWIMNFNNGCDGT